MVSGEGGLSWCSFTGFWLSWTAGASLQWRSGGGLAGVRLVSRDSLVGLRYLIRCRVDTDHQRYFDQIFKLSLLILLARFPLLRSHPPKIPTRLGQRTIKCPRLLCFFSFFGKISGIFHYFNESFVIDPLNDFERHFAWLSKTSLLLKIG